MGFFAKTIASVGIGISMLCLSAVAQTSEEIRWLNFNQLNDSLKVNPKKVFINFYADWCIVCKEMDRSTFKNEKVVEILNRYYYAIKMNVESKDTIIFGNQIFINKRQKRNNPIHEIPLLMASRKDAQFSLPAFIFLDEKFSAQARYFQFLDSKSMLQIISNH